MLAVGPRSGYDIKSFTDQSTRFFWAASYGQIYPELKQLAERGLVESSEDPSGERRRTVYAITEAGREALARWITGPEQRYELRDEGLLKVFFASLVGADEVGAALRHKRAHHQETLERFREIEPVAAASERFGPYEVLGYGIRLQELSIRWCDEQIERLTKGDG